MICYVKSLKAVKNIYTRHKRGKLHYTCLLNVFKAVQ